MLVPLLTATPNGKFNRTPCLVLHAAGVAGDAATVKTASWFREGKATNVSLPLSAT